MKRHLIKNYSGKIIGTMLAAAVFCTSPSMYTFADEGFQAETLTLNPADSTYGIQVNWYRDSGITTGAKVRFRAEGKQDIITDAAVSAATSGKASCKASVNGLEPGTSYIYNISNDGGITWSQDYTYHAPAYGDFTFAFVGDPQLNQGEQDKNSALFSADKTTKTGWADTIDKIKAEKVDFIASAGDQVDTTENGVEGEYNDFFAPAFMQSIPFAPAVGNHDRNPLFGYHFNLPNTVAVDPAIAMATGSHIDRALAETSGNYFYMYNNALFVVLNDSAYPTSTAQAVPFIQAFQRTLDAATAAHPDYKWLFVQHHKSTASVAQHVADKDIQYYVEAGFEKLMDQYQVDFVLAGHDHVYVRSYAMKNGQRTSEEKDNLSNPDGTVYLTCNTGSGLKYYNIFDTEKIYEKENTAYPYLANGLTGSAEYLKGVYPLSTNVAVQNKIPGYTIIKVGENQVKFSTYATYGEKDNCLDTFTVSKN